MGFNGAGTYNRLSPGFSGSTVWQQEEAGGFGRVATRHDIHDQDIALALGNCITKDGQTTISGNLPLGGNILTNVGTGTSRSSILSVGQYQDGASTWGGTSAGTANEYWITPTTTLSQYVEGMEIYFFAHQANTDTYAYCSIGSLERHQIVRYRAEGTSAVLRVGDIRSGALIHLVYTSVAGGQWILRSEEYQQWNSWTPTLGVYGGAGAAAVISSPTFYINKYLLKDNLCYWHLSFTATSDLINFLAVTASLPAPCVNSDHFSLGFSYGTGELTGAIVVANQNAIQFASGRTGFFVQEYSNSLILVGGSGVYELA